MLLLFHTILRHNQVIWSILPLGNGTFIIILPFTDYELDGVVFTIARKECDSFIASAYVLLLPLYITLLVN